MNWSVIMSYKPNFNDPRVVKRIKKAIGFTNGFLSDIKPRGWSTRYIDKFFGHQGNDLSIYLRSKLLICTNDRYSKDSGICKEYIKNSNGIIELSKYILHPSVIQVSDPIICVVQLSKDFIKEEYKKELTSKKFTYEDKSNRLWHDLQRVRTPLRQEIFRDINLKHQYDIESCAITLIHQHSQMLDDPMDLYLFNLRRYLKERKQVRTELANEAEITYEQSKEIINALLMGAQLGHNQDSDIYKMLNGDVAQIEFLKQHQYLRGLRDDIKTCWDYIKVTISPRYITDKNNKQRKLPISNKQKAYLYFDLERKVLNVIRDYLDRTNNKHFLEHDGFTCEKEIDVEELSKWVKINTGFNINLDHKVF
jgi:hypothetical protein